MVLARRAADTRVPALEACDRHSVLCRWGMLLFQPAHGPPQAPVHIHAHIRALKRETLDLYWNETDPLTAAVGVTG